MSGIQAFPLAWPAGWARTPAHKRKHASYRVSLGEARDHALNEARKLGDRAPVISSNAPVKRDGALYADSRDPEDPGVAIYWRGRDGKSRVIACDAWRSLRDNVRAIGLTLASLRQLERTQCTQILERAYQGFAALPAGNAPPKRSWREVFGLTNGVAYREDIATRYRALARQCHPDNGGSVEAMAELNRAREEALKEIGT